MLHPLAPHPAALTSFAVGALMVLSSLGCAAETEPTFEPGAAATTEAADAGMANGKVQTLGIVDRAIAHHGAEALERSRVALRVTSKSGSFDVVAEPGPLFDYQVTGERNGVKSVFRHSNQDGELVEQVDDGRSVPLPGDRTDWVRDFVSQRVYFPFLPYRLGDAGVYFEDLGLESWGGRELHKVKVSFEPGSSSGAYQEYLYWFDPQNAEMAQFAYDFNNGLRLRQMFNTREVEGILFQDARNYAQDGRDRSVDEIVPVDLDADGGAWKLLSTIALDEIEVEAR